MRIFPEEDVEEKLPSGCFSSCCWRIHMRLKRGGLPILCVFCVVVVTLTRVTVNLDAILNPEIDLSVFYGGLPISFQLVDGFARPAVAAVCLVPFFFRYKPKSSLHNVSLLSCLYPVTLSCFMELLVSTGYADNSVEFGGLLMGFCWLSRLGQTLVTHVKLEVLGWPRTAARFRRTWFCWAGLYFCRSALRESQNPLVQDFVQNLAVVVLLLASLGLITAVTVLILLYEATIKQRMLIRMSMKAKDHDLVRQASRSVRFLSLGASLLLVDAIYLPFVEFYGHEVGLSPALFLTFDNSLVLVSVLVLSGLIGPTEMLEEEVLQELAYMALTQGRRIAFPGRVNLNSKHCIVSFPGKYANEWDAAVRMVEVRSGACSLACVFLTDRESGLGAHTENPEKPGECWCRSLYGQVPAAAYISIVEDPETMTEDDLQFKETDARAMGQIFLKRVGQSDEQWQKDKRDAESLAKSRCDEVNAVAPWGCQWFHAWKQNVDTAVELGQMLHVFYFKDRVGCGKLPWHELSNETSVKEARKNGGLGASQTAEVAYLAKCGHQFEQHDVSDFYSFMETHKT